MRKIRALKVFSYNGKTVLPDEIIEVQNNDAHTLIDSGQAVLMIPLTKEQVKIMLPQKRKGYKTK